jgi:hypothetical protein
LQLKEEFFYRRFHCHLAARSWCFYFKPRRSGLLNGRTRSAISDGHK